MITHEPFTAAFTGVLTSFKTRDGRTWTLPPGKPCRVTKGEPFMIVCDAMAQTVHLVPVRMPDYWEGVRG